MKSAGGRQAAIGCRTHTGRGALVVVAGDAARGASGRRAADRNERAGSALAGVVQEAGEAGPPVRRCGVVVGTRASIWDEACWTLGGSADELKHRLPDLRRELGAPWAEDQKLAALAALLALAAPSRSSKPASLR